MPDTTPDTRTLILDAAHEMIQGRGYNAVSFREIAARVHIKAASVHYYFPGKQQLGVAVVQRYRDTVTTARAAIDRAELPPIVKLEHYAKFLVDSFRQTGRMCLCGVLAAESSTLPVTLQEQVRGFFTDNENWLSRVLAAGRRSGDLQFIGTAENNAAALFAGLEGALMTAWTFNDQARLTFTAKWMLEPLRARG